MYIEINVFLERIAVYLQANGRKLSVSGWKHMLNGRKPPIGGRKHEFSGRKVKCRIIPCFKRAYQEE